MRLSRVTFPKLPASCMSEEGENYVWQLYCVDRGLKAFNTSESTSLGVGFHETQPELLDRAEDHRSASALNYRTLMFCMFFLYWSLP